MDAISRSQLEGSRRFRATRGTRGTLFTTPTRLPGVSAIRLTVLLLSIQHRVYCLSQRGIYFKYCYTGHRPYCREETCVGLMVRTPTVTNGGPDGAITTLDCREARSVR